MDKIPFVDLKAQYLSIKEEIDAAIGGVIGDSAFIGGKYTREFEDAFAEYTGAKHCVGVGNGTDALFIALKMLGIGEGDEVVVPANSFIATSEAVTLTGARVVFVDCDRGTYNIDPEGVERAITPQTKAIVPVHLYGQPSPMDSIMHLVGTHGLRVVEDAAQAHGAKYKSRNVGTFGDCACFSFFPGKNLGAYGDGGAVLTNDDVLAEKVRMFANHGRQEKYSHLFEGVNSRLDGLQAAILSVKLRHLEAWTERRRAVATMYDEGLRDVVVTPKVADSVRHVYHLYAVRVKERDKVKAHLSENGISTGIHYPVPLPFLDAYAYLGHKPGDFPNAHEFKDEILSLPIHGDITDEQVGRVIEHLKEAVGK